MRNCYSICIVGPISALPASVLLCVLLALARQQRGWGFAPIFTLDNDRLREPPKTEKYTKPVLFALVHRCLDGRV